MANQYTSILTTPGFADNTVLTAYDMYIESVFRARPMARMFADKRPSDQVTSPGQTVVMQKRNFFDESAITAAKTPLNEEQDVDSRKLPATTTVSLTVNEYGDHVTMTRKLKHFDFANMDFEAATVVGDHMGFVIDELVQDKLVTGTQILYAGTGNTATNQVAAGDYLDAENVRQAHTRLDANLVPTWDANAYACMTHPHVIHDLRQETGSGSWRVPQEYGTNQSMIWNGEFGLFEGVRFVSNTRTRKANDGTSSETIYRSFFVGRQALAEKVVEEPHAVISPQVDKLGRFFGLGWYALIGWALYRNESLVIGQSASSMTAVLV
jgi:N4-gp56 family major capsid protein